MADGLEEETTWQTGLEEKYQIDLIMPHRVHNGDSTFWENSLG